MVALPFLREHFSDPESIQRRSSTSALPPIANSKPDSKQPFAAKSTSTWDSRAMYAADSSNYRQLPIGVILPRDAADVEAALGRLPRHRSRGAASRRGNQPGRPVRERRRRLRFFEIHEPPELHRSREEAGHGPAGHRARSPARGRGDASPHLRARSRHPLALHPRRHDRQQQLRRAWPSGRQGRRQRRVARHRALRRHAHDRGSHQRRRARCSHSSRAAAWARSMPAWQACAIATPSSSARNFPASRAASPATTSTSCCPKTAFT